MIFTVDTQKGEMMSDDTISRKAAIDAAKDWYDGLICGSFRGLEKRLKSLPSVQSEIIRCRDCMHNGSYDTDCPIHWNGKEYCNFAERRTDG